MGLALAIAGSAVIQAQQKLGAPFGMAILGSVSDLDPIWIGMVSLYKRPGDELLAVTRSNRADRKGRVKV